MTTRETEESKATSTKSVAHYRSRAYRDGVAIFVIALVTLLICTQFGLAHLFVSWLYHVQPPELNALAAVLFLLLIGSLVFILRRRAELLEEIRERKKLETEQSRLISRLEEALGNIRTLSGLVPICGWCKKIRDDEGYWTHVEEYLQSHTNARFTHGICPDCAANFRNAQGIKSNE